MNGIKVNISDFYIINVFNEIQKIYANSFHNLI